MDASLWLALLSGVAVAAACGLRAFLPLLLLGLAARAGLVELRGGAAWLAADHALAALTAATVLEVAADKVPFVDNVLDAAATVLRPAAAWLGTFALLSAWPTPWAQIAALVLGAGALAVHAAKAKLRLGSTAMTFGQANTLLSLVEDAFASALLLVAWVAPLLALLVPALLVLALRRRRAAA